MQNLAGSRSDDTGVGIAQHNSRDCRLGTLKQIYVDSGAGWNIDAVFVNVTDDSPTRKSL
jgi:hypothetical protein